jgi:hypothetical protein
MFIITPTYAQIMSIKINIKLLRHVSVLKHHLQGVNKLCQLKLLIIKMIKYDIVVMVRTSAPHTHTHTHAHTHTHTHTHLNRNYVRGHIY